MPSQIARFQNIPGKGHRPEYSDGILFANTNKKGKAEPDFVGRVHVRGARVNLLAWCSVDGKGKPQMILKIKT